MSAEFETLSAMLESRAHESPTRIGYTFLDSKSEEHNVTYAQLHQQAQGIAARLHSSLKPGDRVLLLYPPGPEYLAALFGCFHAGMVPVPAYPPTPHRLEQGLQRLMAIVENAGAAAVMSLSGLRDMATSMILPLHSDTLIWVTTDDIDPSLAQRWVQPEIKGQDLALIQYTSGSTGAPRGVMLTHANLLTNSKFIKSSFAMSEQSVTVSWLPPFHDMGLLAGLIVPTFVRCRVILMSPMDFLMRPIRWLEAVHRYRGTHSGGPNFSYDLCVRKTTPDQRAELDLSSWGSAFCGAEPVRQSTLGRFCDAFETSAFSGEAFYPCYGLAEATLIVTGAGRRGRWREQDEQVGCGESVPETRVAIVDDKRTRVEDGVQGEIWVSGPCVAKGYWANPEETNTAFGNSLAGESGDWLRTGDIGFLVEGDLHITGRSKDLIIRYGQKIHPQDIELTVASCHPDFRPGCTAVFSIDNTDEKIVVVQEVATNMSADVAQELAQAVTKRIAQEHQLPIVSVAIIARGTIPKTSSGKVQRFLARAQYLDSALQLVNAGESVCLPT